MWDQLKKPLVLIVSFFICLFLFIKISGPIPFFVNSVQTTKTDLFHVDGVGKVTAAPDVATVSVGITKSAPTIADAQNQTNTLAQKVIDGIRNLGIDRSNIQTSNYSVSPQYNQNQSISGYTVSEDLDISVKPIDKINDVIDSATKNGANDLGQVSFGFSDSLKKDLEQKARNMAVQDAKERANSLASAAGIHLGQIVDVVENPTNAPIPVRPLMMAAGTNGQQSTPTDIQTGENTISTTITLSYQIY